MELEAEVEEMDDEYRSISQKGSRPPSPNPSERIEAIRTYVRSLPDATVKLSDVITAKEPTIQVKPADQQISNRILEAAQLFQTCMSLPTRRMVTFDGNPMHYPGFIRNFQSTVAKFNNDASCLLDHLIAACEGEAAEAIQRCTVMEPWEGYTEALRILERRFGDPHVIARSCITELTDGPTLKASDTKGLIKLSDQMKMCSATLRHLKYSSDLNANSTLSAIVQRLPHHIQAMWFEKATKLCKRKREATFEELADFISYRGDIAASALAYTSRPRNSSSEKFGSKHQIDNQGCNSRLASIMATQQRPVASGMTATSTNNCPRCQNPHYLDECPQFQKSTIADRYEFLKKSNLCFLCLKPNHGVKVCRSRRRCGLGGCNYQHHPLIHRLKSEVETQQEEKDVVSVGHVSVPERKSNPRASLAILPVRIHGPQADLIVNAFLDSGSDTTLIDSSLVATLGLEGTAAPLTIKTLSGEMNMKADLVSFSMAPLNGEENVSVHRAWSVNALPKLKPMNYLSQDLQTWEHLRDVPLPSMEKSDVRILIGTDVPKAHWVREQRRGGPDDPYAVKGPLGWVILGPMASSSRHTRKAVVNYVSGTDLLQRQLERMFNFEFEQTACIKKSPSVDDRKALDFMMDSMRLVDGHYEIALPWKPGCPCLPDNKNVAVRRLMALKKRLEGDDLFKSKYAAAMEEYVSKGYAELVPEVERNLSDKSVWYLPHHGVYKNGDPTKVRVVFDCAATCDRTSLNQQLFTGPDLVNNLCGVLLRFREYRYTLVADIEAMFHQVKVPVSDRNSLRFLWWSGGDLTNKPKNYRMTAHPFGATSSPSCASLALKRTIEENLTGFGDRIAELAKRAFYVDDCLLSFPSVEEVVKFGRILKTGLSRGGFNLTKFFSNVPEALGDLPRAERKLIYLDQQGIEMKRTLGVEWNSISDSFVFKVEAFEGKYTRRDLLSYVASLFDPLGLVAPALLPSKLLIQDLCRRRADWDEQMTKEEIVRWEKCLQEIQSISNMRISRCISPTGGMSKRKTELHAFSDASEVGYGAVVYLRLIDDLGAASCSLLLAKSRVAPLKTMTIPRLELAAAVVSVKLVAFIQEEMSIAFSSTTYWTDSMIVLQLVRNTTSRLETFVANRLTVIRDHSTPEAWRHVSSQCNPADLVSRGVSSKRPLDVSWFEGPEFLRQTNSEWPSQPLACRDTCGVTITEEVTVHSTQCSNTVAWIQQFKGAKGWTALLRQMAWLRRFCLWLRHRSVNELVKYLTPVELKIVESNVLVLVQKESFQNEYQILNDSLGSPFASSTVPGRLQKLHPFKFDSLLRVGGRLRWATMPFESKHPAILPKDHFVTDLLIRHYHEESGHAGALHVLAALREKYWIVNGLSTVKRTVRSCFHCRRWHARPLSQIMAPLPEHRMLYNEPPFSAVGIDYFGPLLVKRGRGTEKRYGCIFTCLSMRAIHLEVSHTLETDSFLSAFTRFVARRGHPRVVYSDNGTNFRGAEAELKECLKSWSQQAIMKRLSNQDCEWIFTPPKASHHGGSWERMIRSVRRVLVSILADQLVTDEALTTALCEVEKILNDRPLTKVSDDPEDAAVLTPNHLLLLRGIPASLPVPATDSSLTRRWRQAQHVADTFWARWLKEYLPELQRRSKWNTPGHEVKVGDLVLLVDAHVRRGLWPKGIVENLLPGRDGRTRQVMVRTAQGTLRRDVRQLCLLEADSQCQ